ncbi:MAG: hypothetical protein KatS3mg115_0739 [Candidatus Poribacteria bacterium]|nr:MAG: hypothetical protein KatS3mg115_0739 [Candidatus Poribacteria bacterium]
MTPTLAIFANLLAIVGGYIMAVNFLAMPGGQSGMNGEFYWAMATSAQGFTVEDVITSLFKGTVFGMIIATVGCYMGFSVPPGLRRRGRRAGDDQLCSDLPGRHFGGRLLDRVCEPRSPGVLIVFRHRRLRREQSFVPPPEEVGRSHRRGLEAPGRAARFSRA